MLIHWRGTTSETACGLPVVSMDLMPDTCLVGTICCLDASQVTCPKCRKIIAALREKAEKKTIHFREWL